MKSGFGINKINPNTDDGDGEKRREAKEYVIKIKEADDVIKYIT